MISASLNHLQKTRIRMPGRTRLTVFIIIFGLSFAAMSQEPETGWKSGAAAAVITPEMDLWMAGYAAREHPAKGVLQDLKVKAVALQDAQGKSVVFISTDLLGLPKYLSDVVSSSLQERFNLNRSEIMLTSSHTHSGPVLSHSLADIYPLDQDHLDMVEEYTNWLENQMVQVASTALNRLESSKISMGNGQVRFAVNRRNNPEKDILKMTEFNGPVDHSVPVLKIERADGTLQAIVFGYACHATTLNGDEWSGDYPGFAQQHLESKYPGVTAMFFAGCGADQNPLPRRSIPLAKQYGHQLSAAVSRVLEEHMTELAPVLSTKYRELELSLSELPPVEELETMAKSKTLYQRRWASGWLKTIEDGGTIPVSYPWYPVQTWQLGALTWVALGGEVVVDYSNKLRALMGQDIFITAYANDVMAYIPSVRVLKEGGYEGATSMQVYGLPSTWSPEIEEDIITEVQSQVEYHRTNHK